MLYCTEEDSAGFRVDGSRYKRASFHPDRFTVKIEGTRLHLAYDGMNSPLTCRLSDFLRHRLGHRVLDCYGEFESFAINLDKMRFTRTSNMGYVSGATDSLVVSYGTCSDF